MFKLGFIGMGNMASAILKGAASTKFLQPQNVWVYDLHKEKVEEMQKNLGINAAESLQQLVENSDILLIAVKPDAVEGLITQNKALFENKAVISVALGWPHARYRQILPQSTRAVFIMPNTPGLVGEGVSSLEKDNSLTAEELAFAKGIFESIGQVFEVESKHMNVAGTLGGCGPALIYMVIEALADGAVLEGMPRELAYKMAGQMVLGSGKMVLESGEHPGKLKDNVCSPGGSTIRAVRALENAGVRAAFIEAVSSAVKMK